MIRHIVLLRFKPETSTDERKAAASSLSRLPELIPEIQSYDLGEDLGWNGENADFAIVASFRSKIDYQTYQSHPEHQRVLAEHVRPIVESRVAVQLMLST